MIRKTYKHCYERRHYFMANNIVKIIGLAATVIGFGATLLSDWVNEKKMEEMVDEKVNEALAKREENEEES